MILMVVVRRRICRLWSLCEPGRIDWGLCLWMHKGYGYRAARQAGYLLL